jgi:tetratricopeptide (TPR) repeat protein
MAAVWESKPTVTRLFRAVVSTPRVLASLLFVLATSVQAADCATPLARLVLVKGSVELVRQGSPRLTVADTDAALCAGDTVVVHQRSQAALLLTNATVVRLDQGTTVTLSPATSGRPALLSVISGAIYVISRTPQPFRVRTPFINANVEGTEFLVEVRRDVREAGGDPCHPTAPARPSETDAITVYEGRVRIEADLAPFVLAPGETAVATASGAATKGLAVRSKDSVTWTLYVPAILRASPESADGFACARRLIDEGLLMQAKGALERQISAGTGTREDGTAFALLAVLAVAENDREQASRYADRAVELAPSSASSWLARSYAQQSRFKIEEALASANRAVDVEPGNALALARRAELEMSVGRLDAALASAGAAVQLDQGVPRTRVVFGFAQVARAEMKAARASFEASIALDPTDPLPRLGLGLVRIREGDLTHGREDLELAAVLDPSQSLLRSYLGKAYFEERRGPLAEGQFALAKELDPNDPTPWFYDGLAKGADNRLIEAVDAFVESIRLNDRRAVYRSRLLLDEDLAARSASLARSFLEIDLREAAIAQASASLAVDPGSASAHRFLSDAKSGEPRSEITRASELLQAQLRQPLGVIPLQAQLANDRLFTLRSEGPNAAGFNEFGSLFLSNGSSAQLHGVIGNRNTRGEQGLYSMLQDNFGIGVGALHYSTDGTRPNGDSSETEQSAFAQFALTPQTGIQFEYTHRRSVFGDIVSRFEPATAVSDRNLERVEGARIGLRQTLANGSDLLLTVDHRRSEVIDDLGGGFVIQVRNTASRVELQHLWRQVAFSLVSGASYLEGRTSEDNAGSVVESKQRHLNVYAYATYALIPNSTYVQAGLSYDDLHLRDTGNQTQLNPKVGLTWHPATETTARAALFRTLKRRINADAALEPTQVAGFDQYFDDSNGTKAWGYGVAADTKVSDSMRIGARATRRNLGVPLTNEDGSVEFNRWHEFETAGYLHWTLGRVATLSVRPRHTRYVRTPDAVGAEGFESARTTELPVTLRVFAAAGWWSSLTLTRVDQSGRFPDASFNLIDASSRFHVVDAAIGLRFAQRRGNASAECANLFDRSFRFQDIGLEGARFAPRRTCRAKLSLDI